MPETSEPRLRFEVLGLGFEVWGLGFMVLGLGFAVEGLGFSLSRSPSNSEAPVRDLMLEMSKPRPDL